MKTNKEQLEILLAIDEETKRFHKKLKKAIEEYQSDELFYQSHKLASARRSALDLKYELTNLTSPNSRE